MRILIALLLFAFSAFPVCAQNAPIPQKKASITKAPQKLETQLKNIKSELKNTKGDLIGTAKAVQKNERELQQLDLKIKGLEKEQAGLSDKLQKDRGSIAQLILALERIRRLPPEALIVRPESPLKTAQSAMLLEDILPTLNKQAADLKFNLRALNAISEDLQTKRNKAAAASENLKAQQHQLKSLVQKRTQLYASTQKDLATRQKRVARISAQAKDLRDLVGKLDEERTRNRQARPTKAAKIKPPRAGQPRLPLPGIITTGYNQPDNFGAPNKGLDIEGRAGALVVAPMGGIIRFAGYFKNYGNMVILEHEKGWHSLIAGLENIDTVVGQSVTVGEPLGELHKSSSSQKPVLYYELRHKGKPVNPAKKFGDLS